jgi:hypothetical protein
VAICEEIINSMADDGLESQDPILVSDSGESQ